MLRLLGFLIFLINCHPAFAKQAWEMCLDSGDFDYKHDTFTEGTFIARKSGCRMFFASSLGRGEKFELDLCDPLIHIVAFNSTDAVSGTRVVAPPGACSSPLFGADFEENAKEIQDFSKNKRRLLAVFEKVKKAYGAKADRIDLNDPKAISPHESDGKVACAQLLLKSYLNNCEAFEAGKPTGAGSVAVESTPDTQAPNIPGVHPQTILPKKKTN